MGKIRVLVANEPRSYRDAIAGAIRKKRPDMDVIDVDPADIEVALTQVDPHAVISSRAADGLKSNAAVWLVLYPNGESSVRVSIARQEISMSDIDLRGVLAAIDWTSLLVHPDAVGALEGA